MPNPVFLTIEGTQQGLISAGALGEESLGIQSQKDHQDKILVQAINHSIVVPGNGNHTFRMHKPVIVTKPLDKSSPLLNNALCTGELLTTCLLEWYRTTGDTTVLFYSVELKDALVTGMDLIMPHCEHPTATQYTQFERVHLAYKYIVWNHRVCRTLGMDAWQGSSPQ